MNILLVFYLSNVWLDLCTKHFVYLLCSRCDDHITPVPHTHIHYCFCNMFWCYIFGEIVIFLYKVFINDRKPRAYRSVLPRRPQTSWYHFNHLYNYVILFEYCVCNNEELPALKRAPDRELPPFWNWRFFSISWHFEFTLRLALWRWRAREWLTLTERICIFNVNLTWALSVRHCLTKGVLIVQLSDWIICKLLLLA